MKKTLGMVIALNVKRRDGEPFAMQAAQDILCPILVTLGEHRIRQSKVDGRRIGRIDPPTGPGKGFDQRWLVAGDLELKAHTAFEPFWLGLVLTAPAFADLCGVSQGKQSSYPILLLAPRNLSQEGGFGAALALTASRRWG